MSAIHGKRFLYVFLASVFFCIGFVPKKVSAATTVPVSVEVMCVGKSPFIAMDIDVTIQDDGSFEGDGSYPDQNTGDQRYTRLEGSWSQEFKEIFLVVEYHMNSSRSNASLFHVDLIEEGKNFDWTGQLYAEFDDSHSSAPESCRRGMRISPRQQVVEPERPVPPSPNPTPPPVEVPVVQPTLIPPVLSLSRTDSGSSNIVHLECNEPVDIDLDHTAGKWNINFNGTITQRDLNLKPKYTVSDCGVQWIIYLEDSSNSNNKSNTIEIVWEDKISAPTLSLSSSDPESPNTAHLRCNQLVFINLDHTNGKWNINFNGEVKEKDKNVPLESIYRASNCGEQWTIYLEDPSNKSNKSNTINIIWSSDNERSSVFLVPSNAEVKILDIPTHNSDIFVKIQSIEDVDLLLIDNNGNKIIHPNGLIHGISPVSINYNGVEIQYSGSQGDGYDYGHEYIRIIGETQNSFTVYVISEKETSLLMNYSFNKFVIFMGISGGDLLKGDLWDGGDGVIDLGIKSRIVEKAKIDCSACDPSNILDLSKISYNNLTGGIIGIAYNISHTVFSRTSYFSSGNTDQILDDIQANYIKRPNAKIYLVGHSTGGGDVQNLLWKLNNLGIHVNLSGHIDSIDLGDAKIPKNTNRAMGFYQTDGTFITRGENNIFAEDPSKTIITNKEISKPKGPSDSELDNNAYHRNMDNDIRVWKTLLDYIRKHR